MSGMYWYAVAASDDVAGLKNKGFCVTDNKEILYNEQYEYALARMYTNDGHGIVDVETSNFFFDKDASDRITINAEVPMTTPVLSYKLRMTDQHPDAEWFYFAEDKSEEMLVDGVPHPLYKADGTFATKTDYVDCEFEALNPMPSEYVGMYGRFTTATFSFATYQSTADVLHVEFTGLHQEEAEYCFSERLRVVVTASPAPALPTVSVINGIVGSTSSYGTRHIPNGSSVYQWVNNGGWALVTVASGNVIAFQRIANGSDGNVKYSGFDAQITQDGYVQVTNNTGSSYGSAFYLETSVCSSPDASVITVYDSSNNPYNAFKYTSDGTDYYYVLDGTQTDWTDDLSSIGYSLQQIYTAYFSNQGVSGSNVTFDGTSRLYDAGGNLLYYDSTKSYTLITGYLKNGTENNPSEWGVTCYFREQDSSLHTLGLFVNQAFTFYKILYLVTPTA